MKDVTFAHGSDCDTCYHLWRHSEATSIECAVRIMPISIPGVYITLFLVFTINFIDGKLAVCVRCLTFEHKCMIYAKLTLGEVVTEVVRFCCFFIILSCTEIREPLIELLYRSLPYSD